MGKLEFLVGGKVGGKVSISFHFSVQFVSGVIYWLEAEITPELLESKRMTDGAGAENRHICACLRNSIP